jgi:ABC-type branched-subunit amino acid transport system substrate-binding protein
MPDLAERFGLELQSQTQVVASPTVDVLDPIARNLSMAENDPDVVVTCVYDSGCAEWITALRKSGWSPRAQVFTVCIGMDSFVDTVGATDAMFMTDISPWDPSLSAQVDVVGWTAMEEFADLFYANTQRASTYHSASAAASVGALVQAIERSNGFDSDAIATVLANEEFTTLYGNLSFDANGQSSPKCQVFFSSMISTLQL